MDSRPGDSPRRVRASCTIGAVLIVRAVLIAVACVWLAPAEDEGIMPRWQVEELAQTIAKNVDTAARVVEELRPGTWVQDGAPEAYIEQQATLLQEMEHVRLSAMALEREPESLTFAVDTYLWLDRVDALLSSVTAGVRRYYNSAVADLLDSVRNRNEDGLASAKVYMRQLAVHVESSMRVAHQEAQRCRAELISQPRR